MTDAELAVRPGPYTPGVEDDSIFIDSNGEVYRLGLHDGLGHPQYVALERNQPLMNHGAGVPEDAVLVWSPSSGMQPDATRALVAVEAAERLIVRSANLLHDISETDLAAAPQSVRAAVRAAKDLLVETTTVTTNTTCSIVKDQAWSDQISHEARRQVSQVVERSGRSS